MNLHILILENLATAKVLRFLQSLTFMCFDVLLRILQVGYAFEYPILTQEFQVIS